MGVQARVNPRFKVRNGESRFPSAAEGENKRCCTVELQHQSKVPAITTHFSAEGDLGDSPVSCSLSVLPLECSTDNSVQTGGRVVNQRATADLQWNWSDIVIWAEADFRLHRIHRSTDVCGHAGLKMVLTDPTKHSGKISTQSLDLHTLRPGQVSHPIPVTGLTLKKYQYFLKITLNYSGMKTFENVFNFVLFINRKNALFIGAATKTKIIFSA